MTKDVLVHIKSVQDNMDGEVIEVVVPGTYYWKEGKHYVFYEEYQEGFAEASKCQLRVQGDSCLEIIKKGLSNTHMRLDKQRTTSATYATPFGQFSMEIQTKRLTLEEAENEIFVNVEYQMDADGSPIAKNEMKIWIQSK